MGNEIIIYVTISLFSIILTIAFIYRLIKIGEDKRSILKSYVDSFFRCIVSLTYIILICILIQEIVLESELNTINQYKDYLLFIFVIVIIVEIIFMYIKSIVKYFESILIYLIWGVVVCFFIEYLATNDIFNRWVFCVAQLINLKVILDLHKKYYKLEKNNKKINEQICSCYEELFPTRRNQADSIIKYIDSYNDSDKFVLLLNGSWGQGKTSLIKGIEDKCKDKYNMIFIQPMMFDKRDLLVKYFFERLKEVLQEKKIYTGKGSSVERYFMSLLDFINKKSMFGFVENIINKETKNFRKIKEELQIDIKKYVEDKKIIVIVDDFDRVEVETIKEVLMFIKEIIDFEGISIILLMEYSKIVNKTINDVYLQKYIDFRINLNTVDVNEVIEYFLYVAIDSDKNYCYLVNKKSIFIKNIQEVFIQLEEICEEKNKELNKKDRNEEKDNYIEIKNKIRSNLNNIRLIKKIIREFVKSYHELYVKARKQMYKNAESIIELDDDDIKCIFKIIIVKNIFTDEYEKMGNIDEYLNSICSKNSEKNYIISLFNEIKGHIKSLKVINRYKMVESIIKNDFDNIEYQTMTNSECILNELDQYNVLSNEEIFYLKSTGDNNRKFEELYSLIWSNYFEKGDLHKLKKRIKKIEDLFLKHTKIHYEKQGESLLKLYCYITKLFYQSEVNYGFITKIYRVIKDESYTPEELNMIKPNIDNIRINNLNHLSYFIDSIFRLDDENRRFNKKPYINLNDFNKDLSDLLDLDIESCTNENNINNFDVLLEEVKKKINLIKENLLMNKNYMYVSITKYQLIEKIISRIERKVPYVTDINLNDISNLKIYIIGCNDYKEFIIISEDIMENILKSNKFDYHHLNICNEILRRLNDFIDKDNNCRIINLIECVIKKANENKYPHQYTMLELQNLIIYKEEVKKKIYNEKNS